MEKKPTLNQLREELRRAIQETSARAVARELDMSPTGLITFVGNPRSTLYGKTRRKMAPWYERRVARHLEAPEAEAVGPSVAILTRDMGPEAQRRVRKEIARMVEKVFDGRRGVQEAVDAALGDE